MTPAILPNKLVFQILSEHSNLIKEGVLDALKLHHEKSLVQPSKVYLQREGAHTADRIISMPVYAFGNIQIAGMKWIGSHPDNHKKGIERANAIICLNDVKTNAPIAILDAAEISSERTFWMGILGIEKFIGNPKHVCVIGMGKLGKMYGQRLKQLFPSIQTIKCFSESGKDIYAADVCNDSCIACETWQEAIEGTDTIVTTTAKGKPYIENKDIPESVKCIINLSLMDFSIDVFENSKIIVDDFRQCSSAKKVFKQGLDEGRIHENDVSEFGDTLFADGIFNSEKKRILFNTLGMGIEDICCAKRIYDIALSNHKDQIFYM